MSIFVLYRNKKKGRSFKTDLKIRYDNNEFLCFFGIQTPVIVCECYAHALLYCVALISFPILEDDKYWKLFANDERCEGWTCPRLGYNLHFATNLIFWKSNYLKASLQYQVKVSIRIRMPHILNSQWQKDKWVSSFYFYLHI